MHLRSSDSQSFMRSVVAVFSLAAAAFLLGLDRSLEWVDEGELIYFSSRVAEGALPYRDFGNMYGPSLFFLNGAVMRLLGLDIWWVRLLLVVVKAGGVTLVYTIARQYGRPWTAALAAACSAVVWGLPWAFSTTPYAQYFGLSAALAGILIIGRRPRETRGALGGVFAAGLCFGVAATFKQTNGLFACMAAALYLVGSRTDGAHDVSAAAAATAASSAARSVDAVARLVRVAVAVAGAGLFVAYAFAAGPSHTPVSFGLIALPALAVVCLVALREWVEPPTSEQARSSLASMCALAGGAGLPLAAYAAYFAAHDGLAALIHNTLWGLPQHARAFVPLPLPSTAALSFAAVVFVAARFLAEPALFSGRCGQALMIGGCVLGFTAAVGVVRTTPPAAAMITGLAMLPFALVWYSIARAGVRMSRAGGGPRGSPSEEDALLLVFFAATSLLFLHPAAGLPHVLMAAPAAFPLLALPARRSSWAAEPGRTAVRALVAATLLTVTLAPLLGWLWNVRRWQPPSGPGFARASHVRVDSSTFRDALRLSHLLEQSAWRQRDVFVPTGKSMLYFLTGRRSLFDRWEFMFYLVRFDLIDPAYARTVVESQQLLATLRERRPLVIAESSRMAMKPFARTFTEVWTSLQQETVVVERVGEFVVRDWRDRRP